MQRRRIGNADIAISPVALGCWPISGMTSLGVNDADSLATLEASIECGINFFDTAYSYGARGESENLIRRALGSRRDEIVIATKGGLHWGDDGKQVRDARPEMIRRECDESLRRLGTDRVELYYLHAPDPDTPIAETAGAIKELLDSGKIRAAGASNCSVAQLEAFSRVCPLSAVQPHYNMLQREIEADIIPWCRARGVSVMVYWPLMKGLLAGKLPRDYQFPPGDGRAKYPMFQGEEWRKNQDFVDRLRAITADAGCTVAALVVAWTINQPGVTAALCGAKRPDQIRETAVALTLDLSPQHHAEIAAALAARGPAVTRGAV
jgi:aryl-alcohol dehydrogenase-like predicted oxidoreductase